MTLKSRQPPQTRPVSGECRFDGVEVDSPGVDGVVKSPSSRSRRDRVTPSSERNNPRQLRFARRDRTVHRHAVDLLELGQVLVQHLGAGLERRARRLVALVLAAPLAAHTCETLRVVHARAHRCMHAASLRHAGSTHADAGCMRSNSMAPLASGTPCCTTVARGAALGANAFAPRAISATRTFCIFQLICLKAPLLCCSLPASERL